jgi:hypothetical protein
MLATFVARDLDMSSTISITVRASISFASIARLEHRDSPRIAAYLAASKASHPSYNSISNVEDVVMKSPVPQTMRRDRRSGDHFNHPFGFQTHRLGILQTFFT